ncbi:protocatechuate 4,5-dioxygenase subunit alpha [Novosphingobium rosa]|uniref:protocatechuate 4,5-dioxygenase subunit alpha n=1 Tax=Novosphingobium rosa TaxID=76978 RepID=UPI0009FF6765|nr:protocatechuate 4,5-dioxygenase subunit alpha [Novosphingobium rosa]
MSDKGASDTPEDLGEPKGEATGAIGPVGNQGDIAEYLEELEDIPGTRVYTAARARKGYWLNQFAMSLMKEENRTRWRADEKAYLDEWQLSDAVKQALLDRDYNRLLDLGGNIYFLAKVFSTDGLSFLQAVSTMTGMSVVEYKAMMDAGGRSPEGVRSIKGGY